MGPRRHTTAWAAVLITAAFFPSTALAQLKERVPAAPGNETLPVGIALGLIPNSDGFFDNEAALAFRYSLFESSFRFDTNNRSEILETERRKTASQYKRKTYEVTLLKNRDERWQAGPLYLSLGLGGRYTEITENISTVETINDERVYADEKRSSDLVQPFLQASLAVKSRSAGSLWLSGNYVPWQQQNTETVSSISSLKGSRTLNRNDQGLEAGGRLRYELELGRHLFSLQGSFQRLLYITAIVLWENGERQLVTSDRADTLVEVEAGWGLKFMRSLTGGLVPVLTAAWLHNHSSILAENPSDDQTIDKTQLRFGLYIRSEGF